MSEIGDDCMRILKNMKLTLLVDELKSRITELERELDMAKSELKPFYETSFTEKLEQARRDGQREGWDAARLNKEGHEMHIWEYTDAIDDHVMWPTFDDWQSSREGEKGV